MSINLQFSLLSDISPAIQSACEEYRRRVSNGLTHEGMSPGNYLYNLVYDIHGSHFDIAPERVREFYEKAALEVLRPDCTA